MDGRRDLRRRHAGRDRRRMIQRDAERSGLVQGRPVARQHDDQRAGPLVHVVVRRVGRTEPRDVQPRAEDGDAGDRQPAVGGHRADAALRLHARHREHHRRRAQHGRRAARLRRSSSYGFFDQFLKGEKTALDKLPKVRYFTMGIEQVAVVRHLAAAGAQPLTLYLSSGGKANTLNGDGGSDRPRPTPTAPMPSPTIR